MKNNRQTYIAHRAALAAVADGGEGDRKAELAALFAGPVRPVLRVDYLSGTAVAGTNGEIIVDDDKDEDEDLVAAAERKAVGLSRRKQRAKARPEFFGLSGNSVNPEFSGLRGAAYLNYRIGQLYIPSGLILIMGKGSVGKTPLAHALAFSGEDGTMEYDTIPVGEPLAGYGASDAVTAGRIATSMVTSRAIVLDSAKDLLNVSGGAASKEGLSRTAFTAISRWSAIACDLGVSVFVPANASSSSDEIAKIIEEVAISNATMAVLPEGDGWRYVTRRGEGLNRRSGRFGVKFVNDAPVITNVSAASLIDERSAESVISAGTATWTRAMRRATQVETPTQD